MSRKLPGFCFWLQWTLATLVGRCSGRLAAEVVTWIGGHHPGVTPLRILLLGGAIAICQWWVLRPFLPRARWWLVATTLGGGVTGVGTILPGLAQWLVLRPWVPRAGIWIGITTIAGISSWLLVQLTAGMLGDLGTQPWPIPLARLAGDWVEGCLTASVMATLLRQKRRHTGQLSASLVPIPYRDLDLYAVLQPR